MLCQSLPQEKRIRQLIHVVSLAAPRAALMKMPIFYYSQRLGINQDQS
jgi:hypothetical protein